MQNICVLLTAILLAGCGSLPQGEGIHLKDIRSTYIRGAEVTLSGLPDREISFAPGAPKVKVGQNGEFESGQMYLQQFRLARPQHPWPVMLWHGGGLTGATWETTPDGRPGWVTEFLRAGYDTLVSDSAERGRSGFSRYPEIYASEPVYRTKKEAYEAFRIGSYRTQAAPSKPFDGQQFPADQFDRFFLQMVPRWVDNDAIIQRAYDSAAVQLCPCVIVAHSQGGAFALRTAAAHPALVKAIVLLEPSGVPSLGEGQLQALSQIPHLFVWGDYIEQSPLWKFYRKQPADYYAKLKAAGRSTWMNLPDMGLKGNSHMLMMDLNSHDVFRRVEHWIQDNQLH